MAGLEWEGFVSGDTRPTLRFGARVSPWNLRREGENRGDYSSVGLLFGGADGGGVDVQVTELGGGLVVCRDEFMDVAELEAIRV